MAAVVAVAVRAESRAVARTQAMHVAWPAVLAVAAQRARGILSAVAAVVAVAIRPEVATEAVVAVVEARKLAWIQWRRRRRQWWGWARWRRRLVQSNAAVKAVGAEVAHSKL